MVFAIIMRGAEPPPAGAGGCQGAGLPYEDEIERAPGADRCARDRSQADTVVAERGRTYGQRDLLGNRHLRKGGIRAPGAREKVGEQVRRRAEDNTGRMQEVRVRVHETRTAEEAGKVPCLQGRDHPRAGFLGRVDPFAHALFENAMMARSFFREALSITSLQWQYFDF